MNGDMAIIREWAEAKVSGRRFATDYDLEVARHILGTTPAPTMADVEWDDEVHVGLCAESAGHGLVRMARLDTDGDIWFLTDQLKLHFSYPDDLTPIPGTRVDLTPRREPEPESTPDHPMVLTTEADYENAPAGTIVEGALTWTKGRGGCWETFGVGGGCSNSAVAGEARQVLRWGWEA